MATSSGTSSISGIISGMDTDTIVSKLMEIERAPLRNMQARQTIENNKLTAWKTIQANLVNLKIQAMIVNRENTFRETSATSSDEEVLKITSASFADQVTQSLTVNKLAYGQQSLSRGVASKAAALMAGGQITIRAGNGTDDNDVNAFTELSFLNGGAGVDTADASFMVRNKAGVSAAVNIAGAADLQDVIDLINNAGISVKASINDDGTGLKLTDTSGGYGTLSVTDMTGTGAQQLGIAGSTSEKTLNGSDLDPLFTITIDPTNNTLEGIRDAINGASGPFTASIINTGESGSPYKLVVSSKNTGSIGQLTITDTASKITDEAVGTGDGTRGAASGDYTLDFASSSLSDIESVTVGGTAFAVKGAGLHGTTGNEVEVDIATGKLQFFVDGVAVNVSGEIKAIYTPSDLDLDQSEGIGKTMQAAQDAELSLGMTNPVVVSRHGNIIDDVMNGVTFTLLKTSAAPVTVDVQSDTEGIKTAIKGFIDAYNTLMTAIRAQGTYDSETDTKGGPLFGDTTLAMIENQVQGMIMDDVSGVSSNIKSLFQIGISSDLTGTLNVNDTELTNALTYSLNDVIALFTAKTDVAMSSLGATVSVSTGTEAGFSAESVLNGVDTSSSWGDGNGWMSSTDLGTEYFTLNFNKARSISRFLVNTLDSEEYPAASWGISSMAVQYLRLGGNAALAADWITATTVSGNTGAQMSAYLSGAITEKVRLQITGTNAADHRARIAQIQAYEDVGVGGKLNSSIANLTEAGNGLIQLAQDAINSQIEDYKDRIEMLEDRLSAKEARLKKQYAAMEEYMGKMQSTGGWLTQQISSLSGISTSSKSS